jgi:hypothetical protein
MRPYLARYLPACRHQDESRPTAESLRAIPAVPAYQMLKNVIEGTATY